MTPQPLISILLCTYNGAAFLEEQLKSIEEQTYSNIEIICSDNGSTDGTDIILEKWCNNSSSRLFTRAINLGLNINFYNALKFAKGDYIMFCDQDDVWIPFKVERLVSFIQQHYDASMCYGLSQQFSGTTPSEVAIMKSAPRLNGEDLRKTLLISFTLGHNMIISKKVLQQIPSPNTETVAYDWWITVGAMCIGPIKCCEEVLTFWRQHPLNTTKVLNKPFFYKSRQEYLKSFLHLSLIPSSTHQWILQAINHFEQLNSRKYSLSLFLFLMKYADQIFFYKLKKGSLKWISYTKLALKMSQSNFKP
jgi:glycosyltransferase involved in cell wall biosynthesis